MSTTKWIEQPANGCIHTNHKNINKQREGKREKHSTEITTADEQNKKKQKKSSRKAMSDRPELHRNGTVFFLTAIT